MSITGRRAFAHKLIKENNSEIRHRLSKILSSASSSPPIQNNKVSVVNFDMAPNIGTTANVHEDSVSCGNHYYCDTSIDDLVDPIDYEAFLTKNESRIAQKLRPVLLFPSDDIVVEKYQPTLRTLEPATPDFHNLNTTEDPYIQCIDACSLKSLIVVKRYEKKAKFLEKNVRFENLERQEYEVDIKKKAENIKNNNKSNDSLIALESDTATICSYSTSCRSSRPQSLFSTSSTISSSSNMPPLASDEDDRIDDDDDDDNEDNCSTPLAQDTDSLRDNAFNHSNSLSSLNKSISKECVYRSSTTLETIDHHTETGKIAQNMHMDVFIEDILRKNYDKFFNELNINYEIDDLRNMLPIFCLYPPQSDEEMIEFRPKISPPSDVPRYKFLFKWCSLEMDPHIEPMFATAAIYDVKARKKVTENFHFDLNSESMKHLLKSHISFQDLSTLSKQAIFSLSHLNSDMYFVIKLEKIFQSDVNDLMEAYTRQIDDQHKIEKLKTSVKNNCERLGRYRMPFAWSSFPLADILSNGAITPENPTKDILNDTVNSGKNSNSLESLKRIANECSTNLVRKGSLERHLTLGSNSSNSMERKQSLTLPEDLIKAYEKLKPSSITIRVFYRPDQEKFSDDELYKFLAESKRAPNIKRFRSLPLTVKLEVCALRDENSLKCRVNPELVRIHPYSEDGTSPVKEILEFRDISIPHIEHRNLLYVYPKSLNLTSRQNSARNVTIKVQLLSSEEKFSAMNAIFGKSSCPEYLTEAFTAINYHNRCPSFADEFKIRLPSQINKQTHLFFTFIHVHAKVKNDVPIDEIVGYTWLPLWRDDCLQTGSFALPIVSEMPTSGYSFLTPTDSDTLPNLKWIDNHKPLFSLHLDAYSSIFAQDAFVDRFFRITSSLESQTQMASFLHSTNMYDEFCKAIIGLTNANIDSLVKFVHIIMNRLIMLMVKPPPVFNNQNRAKLLKNFKSTVFETLATLVSKINTAMYSGHDEMRSGILSTFVHYQAIIPQPNHFDLNTLDQISDQTDPTMVVVVDGSLSEGLKVSRSFHEEIVQQWLSSSQTIQERIFEHAFFHFDLIFKSICISISLNTNSKLVQRSPIDKSFENSINDLVRMIGDGVSQEIKAKMSKDSTSPTLPDMFHNLNIALAFFIRDLLSILDRHHVFGLVKIYLTKISSATWKNASTLRKDNNGGGSLIKNNHAKLEETLFEMKVNFLRILCGHEHFVALNLPFGTPLFAALEQGSPSHSQKFSPSYSMAKEMLDSNIFSDLIFDRIRPYSELTDEYRRQHWLLGLVFCVLLESFTKTRSSLQTLAANLIRSVLTTFDWDPRFQDATVKHRTACLFLPLIGIMIDAIEQLSDSITKENAFYSALEYSKHKKLNAKLNREDNSYGSLFIENSMAIAIRGTSPKISPDDGQLKSPGKRRSSVSFQPINKEATRILLACFLWTIGNSDHRLLMQYLSEYSNERLLAFLELLRIAMRVFEYKGAMAIGKSPKRKQSFQQLENTIRYGTARRDYMRRRDYSQSFGQNDCGEFKHRWKRESIISRYNAADLAKINPNEEILLEGHLCTMVNLIVLDSITLIVKIFRQKIKCNSSFVNSSSFNASNSFSLKNKYANDEFVVGSALHALLQLFSLKQSTTVLVAAFDFQRALLHHFPELLFIEGLPDVEFCSELCYLLLKHCASQISSVRAQASASIYLLLRQYYQSSSNYSRIKIQITMSLSQLVGTSLTFSEINIKNALNSILQHALNDSTVRQTQFPNQVHELVLNLIMILSNTMQMKEHEKDPETLLDLMYRVAKGYQNSPELRITWLENMAKKHIDLSQLVEAGQCYLHASALVSECLHKISRRPYLPVSCLPFQKVCPNVFEESLNSNSEINIDKNNFLNDIETKRGVQSLQLLSESGLIQLLEHSAIHFNNSGMYEAVNEVYKLLIPIHETHHRYKELAKIHSLLHNVFVNIEEQEGKRVFATYFRVGFYGSLFNDLNQKEFIYKERYLTKLPEIASRLETFYGNRLGPENVEVIKDSNLVDIEKLDPKKAYIQITYVEPYFDSWELESRQTCYEQNYNIKKFIYSTPFTYDGRAHGKLYEQCKRKTILTVEQSFPYVKTRILVKDRQQHSLSPIEVAIEDLQKKTIELANATNQEPVDAKILQMVLQGCVGTTVNQGPAEIAFVFLSDEPNIPPGYQRPTLQLKENLRTAFKEFCARCGEALNKNRKLDTNGNQQQVEYQKELERNFCTLTKKLSPMMGQSNPEHSLAILRRTYLNGQSPTMAGDVKKSIPNKVTNGFGRNR